jgi:hypothetical protein
MCDNDNTPTVQDLGSYLLQNAVVKGLAAAGPIVPKKIDISDGSAEAKSYGITRAMVWSIRRLLIAHTEYTPLDAQYTSAHGKEMVTLISDLFDHLRKSFELGAVTVLFDIKEPDPKSTLIMSIATFHGIQDKFRRHDETYGSLFFRADALFKKLYHLFGVDGDKLKVEAYNKALAQKK